MPRPNSVQTSGQSDTGGTKVSVTYGVVVAVRPLLGVHFTLPESSCPKKRFVGVRTLQRRGCWNCNGRRCVTRARSIMALESILHAPPMVGG